MPETANGRSAEDRLIDDVIFKRDLDEVHLLINFISGRADKSLSTLEIDEPPPHPDEPPRRLFGRQVVQRVAAIRYPPAEGNRAQQAALLLDVKDQLSRLARPARGTSIAYTEMFVGMARLRARRRNERFEGNDPRMTLAMEAFPALIWHARLFKWLFLGLLLFSFVWFALSALAYWDAALGRSILQRTDRFAQQRTAMIQATPALAYGETCASPPSTSTPMMPAANRGGRTPTARAAARPIVAVDTPMITRCGEFAAAESGLSTARRDLADFVRCGAGNCVPIFHVLRWGFLLCGFSEAEIEELEKPPSNGSTQTGTSSAPQAAPNRSLSDQTIASVLTVFGNYVLPMMFALLGTMISAFRTIQSKVRDSELGPRDLVMTLLGLPMGLVAGIAVGLFYSPSETPIANAKELALSAIGLGFLAGYGADSVFKSFDALLAHVFPQKGPASPPVGEADERRDPPPPPPTVGPGGGSRGHGSGSSAGSASNSQEAARAVSAAASSNASDATKPHEGGSRTTG